MSIIKIRCLMSVFAVALVICVAGCGSKDKEAASAPTAPPSNVPASQRQEVQGIKQATQTRGEAEAARAAAFEAARKKAEGK